VEQTVESKTIQTYECRTLSVEDVQKILGLSRSQAYGIVHSALVNEKPFIARRLGNRIFVSKKSFVAYLEEMGL